MLLTMDVGNENIVVCCVEEGQRAARFLLSAERERTLDEYTALMELLARRQGIELSKIEGAIMASVVPRLTPVLSLAVTECTGRKPLVLGPGVKSGLNIRMDDPTELGGDLVAAAVGAIARYPLPCIIVDMGQATAVGVIDGKGSYVGGLICPGVRLSRDSLAKGASQLSEVNLEKPRQVVGKNTREGIRSGILYGAAAMLEGIFARIGEELGTVPCVAVTGDFAVAVIPYCRYQGSITVDEDLIMRGLWHIYQKNQGRQ